MPGKDGNAGGSAQKELLKPYEKLLKKRDNLVRSIFHHEEKIITGTTHASAITRLDQLNGLHTKYQELMEKIVDEDEYDMDDLEIGNEEVFEAYITASSALKTVTKDHHEQISLESTMLNRNTNRTQEVKLPQISIPTFSGDRLRWTTFFDTFSSLVDENTSIPNISKMHYLRDSLSGPAFRTIAHIPISDANYTIAWTLLREKYHDKRAIVNDCIKTFLFQGQMSVQNSEDIRNLIDTSRETIQCIDSLDVNIDDWDPFLVYVLQTKLDKDTAIDWEKRLNGSKDIPKYSEMMDFLETQYRILDTQAQSQSVSQKTTQKIHTARAYSNGNVRDFCEACKGQHYILFCDTFNAWHVSERKKFVEEKGLCMICMKKHDKPCTSKHRCKKCNGTHSTKLHEEMPTTSTRMHAIAPKEPTTTNQKLLATAIVLVQDRIGVNHLLRALIDQGSEGTVITGRASQLLRLPQKKQKIPLTGLDDQPLGKVTKSVRIRVKSVHKSFEMSMEALVMRSIMSPGFSFENRHKNWKHLKNLKFADPEFMSAKNVDLLFGVDIYGIIANEGLRKGKLHEPIAQISEFGWPVFGAACKEKDFSIRIHATSLQQNENLDEALKRFWESEEVQLNPILTEEHEKCVEFCKETTKRLPNGKLEVSLPFNMDTSDHDFLGDTRRMALKRFHYLEKKFEKNAEFYERYKADMLSYLQCNHMSLSKSPLNDGYHVPHHAVIREESTTTKQRTVYDASAKSSNGASLNDRLLNGPTIQPELFDTFIRWRTHKIALVADI